MVSTRGHRISSATLEAATGKKSKERDREIGSEEQDAAATEDDETIGSRLRRKRQLNASSPIEEKSPQSSKRQHLTVETTPTAKKSSPGRPSKRNTPSRRGKGIKVGESTKAMRSNGVHQNEEDDDLEPKTPVFAVENGEKNGRGAGFRKRSSTLKTELHPRELQPLPQQQPETSDDAEVEIQSEIGSFATTIEKIIDYCAGIDGLKQLGQEFGHGIDTEGLPTMGASLALKSEALPILEELALQILHTFATSSYEDLTSYVVGRDSDAGKAYVSLKKLFDNTKKVYASKDHFINLSELGGLSPNAINVARKANLATFITSCFGSGDVGFYHLNEYFLDTFAMDGNRLLKQQAWLFLELKTQAYVSAMVNGERSKEQILCDMFPDDLEQRLLSRRPGNKSLAPSEVDFLQRMRNRRKALREEPETKSSPASLQKKYKWDEFLVELSGYINKNFESIVGVPPTKLKPLKDCGFSLNAVLSEPVRQNESKSLTPVVAVAPTSPLSKPMMNSEAIPQPQSHPSHFQYPQSQTPNHQVVHPLPPPPPSYFHSSYQSQYPPSHLHLPMQNGNGPLPPRPTEYHQTVIQSPQDGQAQYPPNAIQDPNGSRTHPSGPLGSQDQNGPPQSPRRSFSGPPTGSPSGTSPGQPSAPFYRTSYTLGQLPGPPRQPDQHSLASPHGHHVSQSPHNQRFPESPHGHRIPHSPHGHQIYHSPRGTLGPHGPPAPSGPPESPVYYGPPHPSQIPQGPPRAQDQQMYVVTLPQSHPSGQPPPRNFYQIPHQGEEPRPPPPPGAYAPYFQQSQGGYQSPFAPPGITVPPGMMIVPHHNVNSVPHHYQSAPTAVLYERARAVATSKNSSSSRNRPSNVSQRRPWTTDEEKALMAGLDTVKGPHWSSILAMYGPGGTVSEALKGRNQVQLKDKARNLKLFFLKSNIEVPYYLSFVTGDLKRASGPTGKPDDPMLDRISMTPTPGPPQPSDKPNIFQDGKSGAGESSTAPATPSQQATPTTGPPVFVEPDRRVGMLSGTPTHNAYQSQASPVKSSPTSPTQSPEYSQAEADRRQEREVTPATLAAMNATQAFRKFSGNGPILHQAASQIQPAAPGMHNMPLGPISRPGSSHKNSLPPLSSLPPPPLPQHHQQPLHLYPNLHIQQYPPLHHPPPQHQYPTPPNPYAPPPHYQQQPLQQLHHHHHHHHQQQQQQHHHHQYHIQHSLPPPPPPPPPLHQAPQSHPLPPPPPLKTEMRSVNPPPHNIISPTTPVLSPLSHDPQPQTQVHPPPPISHPHASQHKQTEFKFKHWGDQPARKKADTRELKQGVTALKIETKSQAAPPLETRRSADRTTDRRVERTLETQPQQHSLANLPATERVSTEKEKPESDVGQPRTSPPILLPPSSGGWAAVNK